MRFREVRLFLQKWRGRRLELQLGHPQFEASVLGAHTLLALPFIFLQNNEQKKSLLQPWELYMRSTNSGNILNILIYTRYFLH